MSLIATHPKNRGHPAWYGRAQIFGTIAFATIGVSSYLHQFMRWFLLSLWPRTFSEEISLPAKQLDKLSRDVCQLELAENRRFIDLLKSSSPYQQDVSSIVPSEKFDW
jgi:hypothetical protein